MEKPHRFHTTVGIMDETCLLTGQPVHQGLQPGVNLTLVNAPMLLLLRLTASSDRARNTTAAAARNYPVLLQAIGHGASGPVEAACLQRRRRLCSRQIRRTVVLIARPIQRCTRRQRRLLLLLLRSVSDRSPSRRLTALHSGSADGQSGYR